MSFDPATPTSRLSLGRRLRNPWLRHRRSRLCLAREEHSQGPAPGPVDMGRRCGAGHGRGVPMNVLIVYAHPEPRSFNAALRGTAVRVLREHGHAVEVSDLYAMDFNPVVGPGLLPDAGKWLAQRPFRSEPVVASTTGSPPGGLQALVGSSKGRRGPSADRRPRSKCRQSPRGDRARAVPGRYDVRCAEASSRPTWL